PPRRAWRAAAPSRGWRRTCAVSAEPDPSAASPGDEAGIDPDVLAAAAAVADGTWPCGDDDGPPTVVLSPFHLIDASKRAHGHAARFDRPAGRESQRPRSADSSDSLGDALSRAVPSTGRPDLARARRWGPLFVLEPVGSGSFGEVHRAWDPALDRE